LSAVAAKHEADYYFYEKAKDGPNDE